MRFTLLTSLVAFAVVACGGEKKAAASQAEAATPAPTGGAAAAPAAEPVGAVVEVKMTGNGTSVAAFEPNKVTIKAGTVVRFINVSGGPHNVAFYGDSVPKGGADALKKGMPNAMGDLMGRTSRWACTSRSRCSRARTSCSSENGPERSGAV